MKTYAEIAENNLLWAKYGLDIGEKSDNIIQSS